MNITDKLLTINEFSRSGTRIKQVKGIVLHWVANPRSTADGNRKFFEDRKNNVAIDKEIGELNAKLTSPDIAEKEIAEIKQKIKELKKKHTGYGSAHYIIGLAGDIIRCIPDNEIAYHVGASSYKPGIKEKLGGWPNASTIGIECCHLDWDGTITDETYKSMIELTKELMNKYGLTTKDLYRHYDIGSQQYEFRGKTYTGKPCPYFFVKDEDKWNKFLKDLE